MSLLKETVAKIGDLDQEAMEICQNRLDSLTKPPGSLGVLEDMAKKLAGITGKGQPTLGAKAIAVMAGDHGVVAEGVSAFPQEVTPQMVFNFLNQGAAINVLANHVGAKVVVVDVGVAAELEHPQLISKKVKLGTDNMVQGPAMSRDEAIAAIEAGIQVANELVAEGVTILGTGDMGIGNTTPSSAILAACSEMPIEMLVGRGTGVNDQGLELKRKAINEALAVNKPDPQDGVDLVGKVGGLEIAAIAGLVLGAAANRVPVVIDGFIAGAGALVASRISGKAVNFMIPSHVSVEPGHKLTLELLGLKPMLYMDMRLGEGTGAALAMNLVEAAV
ncbi:MAG: nicotinate-nucleotide--dimethylbenzimidazole phosphoribosyltransferase, partial [Bacillota bacterium]|nr:nicotinate-nucleotide--dimethylbenzimidazole phosphoribosyltransferase [Bacillota bacterium]